MGAVLIATSITLSCLSLGLTLRHKNTKANIDDSSAASDPVSREVKGAQYNAYLEIFGLEGYQEYKTNEELRDLVSDILIKIGDAKTKDEVEQIKKSGLEEINNKIKDIKEKETEAEKEQREKFNKRRKEAWENILSGAGVARYEDFKENPLLKMAINVAYDFIGSSTTIEEIDANEEKGIDSIKEVINYLIEEEAKNEINRQNELIRAKEICNRDLTKEIDLYDQYKDYDEVKEKISEIEKRINDCTNAQEVHNVFVTGRDELEGIIERINEEKMKEDLDTYKEEAKLELVKNAAGYDEVSSEPEVVSAKKQYDALIDNSHSISEVKKILIIGDEYLEEAIKEAKVRLEKEKLDKELQEKKKIAKDTLTDGIDNYNEFKENQAVINAINDTNSQIDLCDSLELLNSIVAKKKEFIKDLVDGLKQEKDDKELADAKNKAIENLGKDIDEYNEYKDEKEVREAKANAISSIEEVKSLEDLKALEETIVNNFNNAIQAAKDRIKNEEALEALEKARADAKNTLTKDIEDYGKYQNNDSVKNAVIAAENAIDASKDQESVEKAKNDGIENIIKAITEAKEQDKLALEEAKKKAIDTLLEGIDTDPYLDNYKEFNDALKQAEEAINNVQSIDKVDSTKQEERNKINSIIAGLTPKPVVKDFYIYRGAFKKKKQIVTLNGKQFYIVGRSVLTVGEDGEDIEKLLLLPVDILEEGTVENAKAVSSDAYVNLQDIGCLSSRLLTIEEFNIFDFDTTEDESIKIGDNKNWWISTDSNTTSIVNSNGDLPVIESSSDKQEVSGVRPVYVFDAKQVEEYDGKTIDLDDLLQTAIKEAKETLTSGIDGYEDYKTNEHVINAVNISNDDIESSRNVIQVNKNKAEGIALIERTIERIRTYHTNTVDVDDFKWNRDWKFEQIEISGKVYFKVSESNDGSKLGLIPADIEEDVNWKEANEIANSYYKKLVDVGALSSRLMTYEEAKTAMDDNTRLNELNCNDELKPWYWWLQTEKPDADNTHYMVEYHGELDSYTDDMELGVRPYIVFDKAKLDKSIEDGSINNVAEKISESKLSAKTELTKDIEGYDDYKLQDLVKDAVAKALSEIDNAYNIAEAKTALEEGRAEIANNIKRIKEAVKNVVDVEGTGVRKDWKAQCIKLDNIKFYIIAHNKDTDETLLIPEIGLVGCSWETAMRTAENEWRKYKEIGALSSSLLDVKYAEVIDEDNKDSLILNNTTFKDWWLGTENTDANTAYKVDGIGAISQSNKEDKYRLRPVYVFKGSELRQAFDDGKTQNIMANLLKKREEAIAKFDEEIKQLENYEEYKEASQVLAAINNGNELIRNAQNTDEINAALQLALSNVSNAIADAMPYKFIGDLKVYKDWTKSTYEIEGKTYYVIGERGDNVVIINNVHEGEYLWNTCNNKAKNEFHLFYEFGAISSSLVSKEIADIANPESKKDTFHWWLETYNEDKAQHYICSMNGNDELYGGGEHFNMGYRPMIELNKAKLEEGIKNGAKIVTDKYLGEIKTDSIKKLEDNVKNSPYYENNKDDSSYENAFNACKRSINNCSNKADVLAALQDSTNKLLGKLEVCEVNKIKAKALSEIDTLKKDGYAGEFVKDEDKAKGFDNFHLLSKSKVFSNHLIDNKIDLIKKSINNPKIVTVSDIKSLSNNIPAQVKKVFVDINEGRKDFTEVDGYNIFNKDNGDWFTLSDVAKVNIPDDFNETGWGKSKFHIVGLSKDYKQYVVVHEDNLSRKLLEKGSEYCLTGAEAHELVASNTLGDKVWTLSPNKVTPSLNHRIFLPFGFESGEFMSENLATSIQNSSTFDNTKPYYINEKYQDEGSQENYYVIKDGQKTKIQDNELAWTRPVYTVNSENLVKFVEPDSDSSYSRPGSEKLSSHNENEFKELNNFALNLYNTAIPSLDKNWSSIREDKALIDNICSNLYGFYISEEETDRETAKNIIYKHVEGVIAKRLEEISDDISKVNPSEFVTVKVGPESSKYDMRKAWQYESYLVNGEIFDVLGTKDDKLILAKRNHNEQHGYHSEIKKIAKNAHTKYSDIGITSSRMVRYDEIAGWASGDNTKKYREINSYYINLFDNNMKYIWYEEMTGPYSSHNYIQTSYHSTNISTGYHNSTNVFKTIIIFEADLETLNNNSIHFFNPKLIKG